MKILKSTSDIPTNIVYDGHKYYRGPSYGNLETARREARRFRKTTGDRIRMKTYYIQPSRPYAMYILYWRK